MELLTLIGLIAGMALFIFAAGAFGVYFFKFIFWLSK